MTVEGHFSEHVQGRSMFKLGGRFDKLTPPTQ